MENLKVKASTIARICALIVVLINQCLAVCGREVLPFTDSMVYQVVSLILTIVMAAITCWQNQDITKIALIAGKIFEALEDGEITEEELQNIVQTAEDEEALQKYSGNSFLIGFANGVIANLKKKKKKKAEPKEAEAAEPAAEEPIAEEAKEE